MHIIPVVDLKGGLVVHARRGARDSYGPIVTPLSTTSAPQDVVRGLMALHPFSTLYIADLDAIAGLTGHTEAVSAIARAFPSLTLWLDNGAGDAGGVARTLAMGASQVLGSETQVDTALVARYRHDPRVILSLDFRGLAFQGPPALLALPDLWPHQVIAMTLAKVGSGTGPDMERLAQIKAASDARAIYAAGGVRHIEDAQALQQAGISGALIATALHEGRLTAGDLARLSAARTAS